MAAEIRWRLKIFPPCNKALKIKEGGIFQYRLLDIFFGFFMVTVICLLNPANLSSTFWPPWPPFLTLLPPIIVFLLFFTPLFRLSLLIVLRIRSEIARDTLYPKIPDLKEKLPSQTLEYSVDSTDMYLCKNEIIRSLFLVDNGWFGWFVSVIGFLTPTSRFPGKNV